MVNLKPQKGDIDMNWYGQMLIEIKRMETGFGMRHKRNLLRKDPSKVLDYYNTLCDKINPWEEEHGKEFKY